MNKRLPDNQSNTSDPCSNKYENEKQQRLHITKRTVFITFPSTGAMPIITEARADLTCWEESEDKSYKMFSQIVRLLNCMITEHTVTELHEIRRGLKTHTFTQGRIC